ncbi:hypothetical protein A11A3_00855 [Alcanivorax hongdengensis A-11-3]|uniref:PaaX-like C-terminal domain-containing protein n=1 Tax=Alcanivorax hongdengensis A-11-3 TaxID=1177179 RepID=L0WH11_9GAMM|nr:hypothetical protein A11A3_00855 [Alcanivorax hongdengensis A-11-3]
MSIKALSRLTPKTVVLDILSAAGGRSMPTPALATGGELMGFKPGAIRVAISRLAAQDLLHSPQRGEWKLTLHSPWAREQMRWQMQLDHDIDQWKGHWWIASTALVPRAQRSLWRQHERALLQRGFREARRDIFLRPANLKNRFDELWSELSELGMHENTVLAKASQISLAPKPALWGVQQRHRLLEDVYGQIKDLMKKTAPQDKQSCRRFLQLGRASIRALNTDPLLPQSLAGTSPRAQLVKLMPDFILAGRQCWFRHLGLE